MRRAVLVLTVLAATLAGPAAEARACGASVRAFARDRTPAPPLILGDSTMIFAAPRLARRGFDADARGCRTWGQGLAVVRARKRAGTLPRIVAMFLGANWSISRRDVGAAYAAVGPRRRLVLVTPRETGGGESSDAANERHAARKWPVRVRLLDWARWSRRHGRGWFASDGLHMTFAGAEAFARFVARGVRPLRRG